MSNDPRPFNPDVWTIKKEVYHRGRAIKVGVKPSTPKPVAKSVEVPAKASAKSNTKTGE